MIIRLVVPLVRISLSGRPMQLYTIQQSRVKNGSCWRLDVVLFLDAKMRERMNAFIMVHNSVHTNHIRPYATNKCAHPSLEHAGLSAVAYGYKWCGRGLGNGVSCMRYVSWTSGSNLCPVFVH